jgi:carboxymethylenebutenolidase
MMPRTGTIAAVALAVLVALGALLLVGCQARDEPGAGGDEQAARMAAEHAGDEPVPGFAGEAVDEVRVTAGRVPYATVAGREVSGYLAQPAGAETRPDDDLPALIVIHEWWGLNEHVQTMARLLAQHGYKALAVDLYGGEVADDPQAAQRLMQGVDEGEAQDNLRQAHRYLAGELESPRIGVIGWCFGGGWALQTALLVPELDAAVVYYGRLVTDRDALSGLEVPVLGIFGAEDSSLPVASVRELERTLEELGKPVEIHVYDGAGHAFANPSGERYVPEAARDAWQKTLAFLAAHLEGGPVAAGAGGEVSAGGAAGASGGSG